MNSSNSRKGSKRGESVMMIDVFQNKKTNKFLKHQHLFSLALAFNSISPPTCMPFLCLTYLAVIFLVHVIRWLPPEMKNNRLKHRQKKLNRINYNNVYEIYAADVPDMRIKKPHSHTVICPKVQKSRYCMDIVVSSVVNDGFNFNFAFETCVCCRRCRCRCHYYVSIILLFASFLPFFSRWWFVLISRCVPVLHFY